MNARPLSPTQTPTESVNAADLSKAMLNLLEDFSNEKAYLEQTQRAIVNILDDFALEKETYQQTQRAALNILEDFTEEKTRLEDTQRAALNILEDSAEEKTRLEQTQRAMLNLLDDFNEQRDKTEAANRQLRETIDSLRRAKDAADAASREVEAFAYSVSHDLRAPLRSISGFSHALLEDYYDRLDKEGKDSLQRIVAATEKMGHLIDDLLRLSRLTRAEVRRDRRDLSEMVWKIAEAKKRAEPERKVELVIEEGLVANVDDQLIAVALENLIDNAWKFTARRDVARIEFGSTTKGGATTYFVRDNGAGLDMTYAGKLFQPFQRLHKPEDFPGTGIGLATVRRVIDRHGGMVWIEGVKDKGAVVYFTLGDAEE